MQHRADPCVFMLFHDVDVDALLTLHVGDILCAENARGWPQFDLILKQVRNSGILRLGSTQSIVYLGLGTGDQSENVHRDDDQRDNR